MPRGKRRPPIARLEYTGDRTPTVRPHPSEHHCQIPRNAKHGRIYHCWCGEKFRFNADEGLGVKI